MFASKPPIQAKLTPSLTHQSLHPPQAVQQTPVIQRMYEPMEVDSASDEEMDVETDLNPYRLRQNCYFCTITYLAKLGSVEDLVERTDTMQQDTAQPDEIRTIIQDAGLHIIKEFVTANWGEIDRLVKQNKRLAIGYRRSDGTGHMVAAEHGRVLDAQQSGLPESKPYEDKAVEYYVFIVG